VPERLHEVKRHMRTDKHYAPQNKIQSPGNCAHLCMSVDLTFCCPTPYTCNVQHDVQNVKCHIILSGLMQHLFKFWSSADHYRHLILVKQLIHLA